MIWDTKQNTHTYIRNVSVSTFKWLFYDQTEQMQISSNENLCILFMEQSNANQNGIPAADFELKNF